MALNIVSATDDLLGRLKATWESDTPAVTAALYSSAVPQLVFEPLEKDMKPHPLSSTLPWARVTLRHATGAPAALGNRLKKRTGKLFVQVFVPNVDGSAYTLAQQLGSVAQKAFEATRGLVSITSAAVQEKGSDGSWYRVDCTIDFWWLETR